MSWLTKLLRRAHREVTPDTARSAEPGRVLEQAIAEFNARRWACAEPLFRAVIDDPATGPHDREVARNIYGTLLERNRRTSEAIAVYEANAAAGVLGSYPYERLAAIYRKLGRPDDELRLLQQAVSRVERETSAGRADLDAPLERLRGLLAAARARGDNRP